MVWGAMAILPGEKEKTRKKDCSKLKQNYNCSFFSFGLFAPNGISASIHAHDTLDFFRRIAWQTFGLENLKQHNSDPKSSLLYQRTNQNKSQTTSTRNSMATQHTKPRTPKPSALLVQRINLSMNSLIPIDIWVSSIRVELQAKMDMHPLICNNGGPHLVKF